MIPCHSSRAILFLPLALYPEKVSHRVPVRISQVFKFLTVPLEIGLVLEICVCSMTSWPLWEAKKDVEMNNFATKVRFDSPNFRHLQCGCPTCVD